MKVFDKFGEGLLRALLDFGQVDTTPPFLPTDDELANKFVRQVLKTSGGRPLNHDYTTHLRVAGK